MMVVKIYMKSNLRINRPQSVRQIPRHTPVAKAQVCVLVFRLD